MKVRRIALALGALALVGGLAAGSTAGTAPERPVIVAGPQSCC